MPPFLRRVAFALGCAAPFASALQAGNSAVLPEALRGANPDMLSGGLFAALDAEGAFGARPAPARARAGYADLSKGRPPAVLDARVGLNLRLGDDPDALPAAQRGQSEPHIVRSFANTELLLATFQEGRFFDSGAISCGYAVSRDGGLTWTRGLTPNLTTATGGRFNRATDPVAGAGPQGDLYLQALASVSGVFAPAAVVVSRSTDGGTTWSAPATVFQSAAGLPSPDKNWLAVNDYAGAPNSGRLVSTWTNFVSNAAGTTTATPLVASISDDRGTTWSAPIEITPTGSLNQGTQPLFLPDGSLAVIYISFLDPNDVRRFSIQCKRSLDGGRTFPGAASTVVASVAGWDDPDLRDGIFLPSAAVRRETGELFVTYTALVNGSPRVMLTESSDQGTTWRTPLAISDQPEGVSVMNPAVAVTPGTVAVVFIDKRNAADGRNFVDLYAAIRQRDFWLPNVRLTTMSSDIRYAPNTSRGYMLGDYLAVAPGVFGPNLPCVAVWCDTRSGDSDPFTVRFTPPYPYTLNARQIQPYNDWVRARFATAEIANRRTEAASDPDNDGATNIAEFELGTDPRKTDYGETLVLTRSSDDTLDVAWARRRITLVSADVVTATVLPADGTTGTTSLSASRGVASAAPSVDLTAGWTWTAAKIQQLAGRPVSVTRAFDHDSSGFNPPPLIQRSSMPDTPTSATNSRLINLATRGRSGAGFSQMIVGFVLEGNKSMLVRAAGPALAGLGVTNALADPRLTLAAPASDFLRTNDNWQQAGGGATTALFTRVGAFPFATNSLDAALALDLGAQNYTAVVSSANNTSGVALVEAYDAEPNPGTPASPRLVNLSTRGEAGAGDHALIAGFVISGTQPRRVLVRAVGPSLGRFDVAGFIADPMLTLFRGNTVIATNDDWEISRSAAAIAATAQRVGAFPLNPASLDSALLITLAPGAYTVVISGVDGGTGIALVEVYDAD